MPAAAKCAAYSTSNCILTPPSSVPSFRRTRQVRSPSFAQDFRRIVYVCATRDVLCDAMSFHRISACPCNLACDGDTAEGRGTRGIREKGWSFTTCARNDRRDLRSTSANLSMFYSESIVPRFPSPASSRISPTLDKKQKKREKPTKRLSQRRQGLLTRKSPTRKIDSG